MVRRPFQHLQAESRNLSNLLYHTYHTAGYIRLIMNYSDLSPFYHNLNILHNYCAHIWNTFSPILDDLIRREQIEANRLNLPPEDRINEHPHQFLRGPNEW